MENGELKGKKIVSRHFLRSAVKSGHIGIPLEPDKLICKPTCLWHAVKIVGVNDEKRLGNKETW